MGRNLYKTLRERKMNFDLFRSDESKLYGAQLFKNSLWGIPELSNEDVEIVPLEEPMSTVAMDHAPIKEEPVAKVETEKAKTFKSMEKFVDTEMEKKEERKIVIPGEAVIKPASSNENAGVIKLNTESKTDDFSILVESRESIEELDVLFLGETPKDFSEEHSNDLLSKMISAMKLPANRTARLFIKKTWSAPSEMNDEVMQIYRLIHNLSPKVVVTLGAVATNILLRKRERLSVVHGKFQTLRYQFEDTETQMKEFVPVFHPDLLNINPNMKRSAWIDLQEVLKRLEEQ